MSAEERELLARGLELLGIPSPPDCLSALETYRLELERWNRRYGFVKAGGADLVVRHFLDSLAGLPRIARLAPRTLLDVGSGAGFPGIPLAVLLNKTQVTLLERSAKKAAFLRNIVLILGLSRVLVEERQLKELAERGERFDVVTFRALSPLARDLDRLHLVTAAGGHIVSYKGKRERIEEELAVAGLAEAAGAVEVVPLRVPFLEKERHLVIIAVKQLND